MSTIIGIDILAGTSSQKLSSTRTNKFAAVVMRKSEIIDTHDSISMKNLIKLCRRYEPDFLGVDNIFELESNSAKIIKFCSRLPLETKIIQVTGAPPDGFESISRLARRHNIPYPSHHANPIQTAEIICQLAEKKVGYILLPFEDETEIKISRSRSVGRGGWSQQRYSRKMRGEILNLTRDIEKQLQDHDFDFDLEVRKTEYGYDNAVFRVYTSLVNVRKVVKPFKGELSRVGVSPIRKKRLEFIPASGGRKTLTAGTLRKSDRGLIVGIDPGHNTGIAVMNFSGKQLLVDSLRSAARGDIIRKITQLGDPTIVAADVKPPPSFVEKIAKMLNAKLYYPEKIYSSIDKKQLVNDYSIEKNIVIKGSHKKDALFAALKAYNKYRTIFERINKALSNPTEISLRNKVKQLVVKEGMNIQEAIDEIKQRQVKIEPPEIKLEKEEKLTEKEQSLLDKVNALKEMGERQTKHIENLEDMNEELEKNNQQMNRKVRNLKKKIDKITRQQTKDLKRDRAIQTRDDELKFLRRQVKSLESELVKVKGIITDLKRMIVMGSGQIVVPMKVVFEFSREGIEKTIERMNIEPFDVVLLVDPSGGGQRTAEMLIEREIKAVVCAKNNISYQALDAFLQADVPVLFHMPIRQIDDIAVTYYEDFQKAIDDWEEERQKILGEKTEEKLDTLISEYKEKRKRELEHIYQAERKKRKPSDPQIQPRKIIKSKKIDED